MTKAFNVAGHVFHLVMPDSISIWPRLDQYNPFEVSPVDNPLFTLELVREFPDGGFELVYDPPVEPGETVIKLYRSSDAGWQFEMSPCDTRPIVGRMRSSGDFKYGQLCLVSRSMTDAIFSINNSLMLLYALCTADKGTLEMHASVIRKDGHGFLFLAKSGTGKSTHSQLWLDNIPGSELLNDDNPIVRIWPDGRIVVYGSPWSGKTPCYKNIGCPVGAFVLIRRCKENKITRLSLLESYAMMYSSCSGFKADEHMADGLHSSLEAAVTGVRCYVLDCLPDAGAAEVCSAEVLKTIDE